MKKLLFVIVCLAAIQPGAVAQQKTSAAGAGHLSIEKRQRRAHIHVHALVLDGVFAEHGSGGLHSIPPRR